MKACIAVYSPTTFRVDGSYSVRLLDLQTPKTYDESRIVLEAGTAGTLERGIYGTCSDGDDVPLAIQATPTGKETIDYDMVVLRDKDSWPKPPVKTAQLERIGTAFPAATEPVLDQFLRLLGRGR